jgi:hypothetical protein
MAIQKENVSIDVQDIIDLLHSGYTWFKKDDLGYGSIQEKFNALDIHIKTIQKHPDLKDVDTIAKVFTITNRNKQDNGPTITSAVNNSTNEFSMASLPKTDERSNTGEQRETGMSNISDRTIAETASSSFATADSELSAFASL